MGEGEFQGASEVEAWSEGSKQQARVQREYRVDSQSQRVVSSEREKFFELSSRTSTLLLHFDYRRRAVLADT